MMSTSVENVPLGMPEVTSPRGEGLSLCRGGGGVVGFGIQRFSELGVRGHAVAVAADVHDTICPRSMCRNILIIIALPWINTK